MTAEKVVYDTSVLRRLTIVPDQIMPSTHQLEGTFFAQFEQNNDDSVGDAQLISSPTNPGIFFAVLVDVLPNLSPL